MAAPLLALSFVAGKSIQTATGAASANVAIPTDGAGQPAKAIRVALTAAAWVRMGKGAQTAVAGDMMIQPGDAVLLACGGCDNIAAIQVAAAGVMSVVTIENYA